MPATEAGTGDVKIVTHMCETGHSMQAPSPQKTAVKNQMTHLKDAAASSQAAPSRLINKDPAQSPERNSQKLSKV